MSDETVCVQRTCSKKVEHLVGIGPRTRPSSDEAPELEHKKGRRKWERRHVPTHVYERAAVGKRCERLRAALALRDVVGNRVPAAWDDPLYPLGDSCVVAQSEPRSSRRPSRRAMSPQEDVRLPVALPTSPPR